MRRMVLVVMTCLFATVPTFAQIGIVNVPQDELDLWGQQALRLMDFHYGDEGRQALAAAKTMVRDSELSSCNQEIYVRPADNQYIVFENDPFVDFPVEATRPTNARWAELISGGACGQSVSGFVRFWVTDGGPIQFEMFRPSGRFVMTRVWRNDEGVPRGTQAVTVFPSAEAMREAEARRDAQERERLETQRRREEREDEEDLFD